MMADMLASGLNSHLAGFHTAPKWIELEVIRWISDMLTGGIHRSGLLTSGGSLANIWLFKSHDARWRMVKFVNRE